MKFWNNIISGLKARKGKFTGTSGKGAELASTAIKNIEFNPASENAKITFTSSDKQYDS